MATTGIFKLTDVYNQQQQGLWANTVNSLNFSNYSFSNLISNVSYTAVQGNANLVATLTLVSSLPGYGITHNLSVVPKGYYVTANSNGLANIVLFTSSNTVTFGNLTKGNVYNFYVVPTYNNSNALLGGTPNVLPAVYTIPCTPTLGTASASGSIVGAANITFTPPADTGGGAVTYTAKSSPGCITASSNTSPIVMTGLTLGTSYTFTITATNSMGSSSYTGPSGAVSFTGQLILTNCATGMCGFSSLPPSSVSGTQGSALLAATSYSSPGTVKFIVPSTATYKFTLVAPRGVSNGGGGGVVTANATLTGGTTLYVTLGNKRSVCYNHNGDGGAFLYPGPSTIYMAAGGMGGAGSGGPGGGGASTSTAGNPGGGSVAAPAAPITGGGGGTNGGGGGGGTNGVNGAPGGNGGAGGNATLNGSNGTGAGGGGFFGAGGNNGCGTGGAFYNNGLYTFGGGGAAGNGFRTSTPANPCVGGGGGGGYSGGGGGSTTGTPHVWGAGGGGSNFIGSPFTAISNTTATGLTGSSVTISFGL